MRNYGTRIFNGKVYEFMGWFGKSPTGGGGIDNAKKELMRRRKDGRNVRLAPVIDGWTLWEAKK